MNEWRAHLPHKPNQTMTSLQGINSGELIIIETAL